MQARFKNITSRKSPLVWSWKALLAVIPVAIFDLLVKSTIGSKEEVGLHQEHSLRKFVLRN